MLSLTHAQFSDAGLEKLTGLTRLRELDLFSAICITDVGIALGWEADRTSGVKHLAYPRDRLGLEVPHRAGGP